MTGTLWQSWTVRQLQHTIHSQSPTLLEDLEYLLPALHKGTFNTMDLYTRHSLSRVVESFLPPDAFRSKRFRLDCLNRLPPHQLSALSSEVMGENSPDSFSKQRDLLSSKPWKGSFAKKFVKFFALPEHFLPVRRESRASRVYTVPASPDDPICVSTAFKQLKDFQFEIYFEVLRRLSVPRSRFIIQMPTGSGKTRTSMEFICATINSLDLLPPVVIWLAHSQELCEQAFQCFLQVWAHLSSRPLIAVRAWGEHEIPEPAQEAMFVVASFQKVHATNAASADRIARLKRRCTLIVIDEAHKAIAPSFKAVVWSLKGEDTRIVGLTATPGRSLESEVDELSAFFHNQRIEISSPAGVSTISMLRDRGILSHATFVPIITEINIPLSLSQRRRLSSTFDFPQEVIANLGNSRTRNLEIAKRLIGECEAGRRVLLFACSVAHSIFLTSMLMFLGYRAGHIDGSTPSDRRAELIEAFRAGRISVLSNYGVLSTGFDAPNTDVVFITRPTASPVLYSQMIGRGLRGPAIGGTARCTIIDVRDNIEGYSDEEHIYCLFDDSWS